MIFDDFELTITGVEPPADGANVIVRGARQETGIFSLAAVAEAVSQLNTVMQQRQPAPAVLEQAGARLFNVLFTGKVRESWRESWTIAQTRQRGLRLHLYSTLPAVMAVPWEYLYDPDQLGWLTLHPALSLVRTLPATPHEPPPVADRLRVLVMLANPQGLPPLDSAQEWAQLQALADNTAAFEFIQIKPTYAALLEALRQHEVHVFHFVGHGSFGADGGEGEFARRHLRPVDIDAELAEPQGMLFFVNEQGEVDPISASKLAPLLAGCKTLRLAFLNACQGANAGTRSAFAGLAQRLLQQAAPAVLAMQTPIYDDHAIRFSREFYAALADGLSVEEAVGQGRKLINDAAYTWGIPAFYFQGQEAFTLPSLGDAEKAVRFWQKMQQLPVDAAPNRRRTLLANTLKCAPTHAAARQALERLNAEEEAAQLYPTALDHYRNAQWREAYRTLEGVEQRIANFRDTRALLAEIRGKLGPLPSASVAPVQEQYQPLLNALREGRLVPFLGWDVSRFGRPPQDSWVRGKYLPSAEEAARELAGLLANPVEGALSLLQIAQYTTLLEGDSALYQRLHELYTVPPPDDYPPTLLHRLLAELPQRLRAKGYPTSADRRFVIFSTALDDLLERAFTIAEQPYHLFTYRHRYIDAAGVTQLGRFFHTPPTGEPVEVERPNEYNGHDGDRLPVIIKLCGRRITAEPEPDSVIVTEDQFLEYLPTQTVGELLPPTLLRYVRGQSFVFFGYTLQPWHFRLLWQRMRYQKSRLHGRSWAVVTNPTLLEQEFWRSQEIVPLNLAPEDVVTQVNAWLDRLESR